MRTTALLLVLCASAGTARADDAARWDGKYTLESRSGDELCPYQAPTVVVKGAAFSVAWNIRAGNDHAYKVGVIEGTVRPSGMATMKAKLLAPMPADALAALEQMDDSVAKVKELADGMTLRFKAKKSDRVIELVSGNCWVSWIIEGGDDDAKPSKPSSPPAAKAAPVKAAPPVPAGSSTWDMSYVKTMSSVDDEWRCPMNVGNLVVKQGRFSIPWHVEARNGRGDNFGDMTIGQLDGTIAANGAVKFRPWFSISELPPEIADGRPAKTATLDYVRALPPKMTFTKSGSTRTATMTFGEKCEYNFESASTFKQGRSQPSDRKANGAKCSHDADCTSSNCANNRCAGKSGSPDYGSGMACKNDSDCASDQCRSGVCE